MKESRNFTIKPQSQAWLISYCLSGWHEERQQEGEQVHDTYTVDEHDGGDHRQVGLEFEQVQVHFFGEALFN